MKLLIALCLAAVVAAAPPSYRIETPSLLKYNFDNTGYGGYRYEFQQTDGQAAEQYGEIRNEGREDESLAVKGSYQWVGPDGVTYVVKYTADENGYQPEIEQGPGGGVPPGVVASLLG